MIDLYGMAWNWTRFNLRNALHALSLSLQIGSDIPVFEDTEPITQVLAEWEGRK